ncbi:MAG TPA: hypothetical protein VK815_03565 [Candidatus Acidoferrales bacterium]|nr:hypothetical protein [Candidatus Acidoferrales bacterium]
MKHVRWHNLLAWGVACCCAGMVPAVVAQTNVVLQLDVPKPQGAKPEKKDDKSSREASPNFVLISPGGEDWTRHFQMGAVMAFGIHAKFHEDGTFQVHHDAGTYDDGYVRQDDSGDLSHTANWGYEHASQYDAAAQTMTFTSVSDFKATGDAKQNGDPSFGLDLAYGDDYIYYQPAHMRIGWELGFDFLPINIKDDSVIQSATGSQTTYVYNTGGIEVPDAPYHGGSSGQGPELPTSPSSTSTSPFGGGTVTGSRSLDMDLFSLRLGPSLFWDISENLGLSVSGGPVIGCVTGRYNFDETVLANGVDSHNKGSFGATELVYGGYVNAMLKYHIVDNGRNAYLFLGAQYTPMTTAHFSSSGRSADLNLSGQVYLSVGMGWPF